MLPILLVLASLGTRYAIIVSGLIATLLFIFFFKSSITRINFYSILAFFFVIVFGTANGVLMEGRDFSIWQIMRSQIAFIALIVFVIFTQKSLSNMTNKNFYRIINVSGNILLVFCILFFVNKIIEINVFPVLLETLDGSRVYPIGYDFFIILIPIFYALKKYIVMIMACSILILTMSKTLFLFFFIIFYFMLKSNELVIPKFSYLIFIIIMISGFVLMSDRILNVSLESEARRIDQILLAFEIFYSSIINSVVGIGIGTKYSEGYLAYSSFQELTPLVVNSMYDIENGFLFLLTRFGIFGSVIFIIFLNHNFKGVRFFVFSILSISFLATSPVGFNYILFVFGLMLIKTAKDKRII
jgi:hypothetical protein